MWFEILNVKHHLLSMDVSQVPLPAGVDKESLVGRSMVVKKTQVVPIECVVRGYLSGSGWKEYRQSSKVCGIQLPAGLTESDKLPEPIFTPATKADEGHDINISFEEMCDRVGKDLSEKLRSLSLDIYRRGADRARERGIIIADTKFEFGQLNGDLILIDEVLTPDSSRFWPADLYQPGKGQPSYDKQFVRDWLESTGWDKDSQPPSLPADIIAKTREKYVEAFEQISGKKFPWR
jgi:phosphoribosylaminoimidazole-succinocarboxamide synthase